MPVVDPGVVVGELGSGILVGDFAGMNVVASLSMEVWFARYGVALVVSRWLGLVVVWPWVWMMAGSGLLPTWMPDVDEDGRIGSWDPSS